MVRISVLAQVFVTFTLFVVFYLIGWKGFSISYLATSCAVILPNIFCIIALHFFAGFKQMLFWFSAVFNKFISAVLLLLVAILLSRISWSGFIVGLIVSLHVPIVVATLYRKK